MQNYNSWVMSKERSGNRVSVIPTACLALYDVVQFLHIMSVVLFSECDFQNIFANMFTFWCKQPIICMIKQFRIIRSHFNLPLQFHYQNSLAYNCDITWLHSTLCPTLEQVPTRKELWHFNENIKLCTRNVRSMNVNFGEAG